jgi:hypothetical protein
MSGKFNVLHSHSGLERELKFKKHVVLVDEEYKHMFLEDTIEKFKYLGKVYYKVPILSFVRKGGIFKNFTS